MRVRPTQFDFCPHCGARLKSTREVVEAVAEVVRETNAKKSGGGRASIRPRVARGAKAAQRRGEK